MAASFREDLSINTIIGPGTSLTGDIDAGGFVRIDGALRGNLKARGRVVIGEKARLKSDIEGMSVTVGGVVKGNILAAERVTVLATALVLGDIVSRRVQADEGCLIQGRVIACGGEGDWQERVDRYRDELAVRSALSRNAADTVRSDG